MGVAKIWKAVIVRTIEMRRVLLVIVKGMVFIQNIINDIQWIHITESHLTDLSVPLISLAHYRPSHTPVGAPGNSWDCDM